MDSARATVAQSAGVVLIDTELGYQNASAAGTGIVLTAKGEVLTNYHVVAGATSVSVVVASTGRTYSASVVGDSQTGDVALLQLKGASGLTTATIDDDTVARGDAVHAVGNAGGTNSLTAADGTVTALDQDITTESEGSAAGEDLTGLIETSADVVAGDSGGPLYDHEGEVVGIDTAASTGAEINGYAIPIDDALSIVQQIRSGAETRSVRIGPGAFLGVEVSPTALSADDLYSGWDTGGAATTASGAVVAGVIADGPAANAGLTVGDVITAVGRTPVGTADEVSRALATHDAGDRVRIIWTDSQGQTRSVSVTLATSPVV